MQIVIEISEEEYQTYINHTEAILDSSIPLVHQDLLRAVINGTPLPKDHGRLIDADKLKLTQHDIHVEAINYRHRCISIENIDEAPTIIEKEGEEDDEI